MYKILGYYKVFLKDELILHVKDGIKYTKTARYNIELDSRRYPGDELYEKYGVFKELK